MTAVAIPASRVFLLHRTFPCCGGRSLACAVGVTCRRKCRTCGALWTVRRVTRAPSEFAKRLAVRVDVLEWERAT
jgi:hypothetical protein